MIAEFQNTFVGARRIKRLIKKRSCKYAFSGDLISHTQEYLFVWKPEYWRQICSMVRPVTGFALKNVFITDAKLLEVYATVLD